jgi:chlorobactene glucosyltransferase
MGAFVLVLQSVLTVLAAYLTFVTLTNLRALKRLAASDVATEPPLVSVLVPARNEERNIGRCVEALLAQEYPSLEVLVLDDHSTDRTAEIVQQVANRDPQLRLLHGTELPDGWLGKHWACHQLAQAASGQLFLFVDADTALENRTIRDAVAALSADRADLVSLLPIRVPGSWVDRMVFPVIDWTFHAWVPFAVAYAVRVPALSLAFGQFLLFRREAYERLGGYEAIKEHVVDDIELGRRTTAAGLRWRLYDGSGRVRTYMYANTKETLEGFAKNIFAFFGARIGLFMLVWLAGMAVVFAPVAVILATAAGGEVSATALVLACVTVGLLLATWAVVCVRFGHGMWCALAYPVPVAVTLQVALRSMVLTLRGRTQWKGRPISGRGPE